MYIYELKLQFSDVQQIEDSKNVFIILNNVFSLLEIFYLSFFETLS